MLPSGDLSNLSSRTAAHRKLWKTWTIATDVDIIILLNILVVTKCILLHWCRRRMLLTGIKPKISIGCFSWLTILDLRRIFWLFHRLLLVVLVFNILYSLILLLILVLLAFLVIKLICTIFILLEPFFEVIFFHFLLISQSISLNKFFYFTFYFLFI